jgi:hypothetical protein
MCWLYVWDLHTASKLHASCGFCSVSHCVSVVVNVFFRQASGMHADNF